MYYKNLAIAVLKTSFAMVLLYKMITDWKNWWNESARSVTKKAFFTPSIVNLESHSTRFSVLNGLLKDLRKEFDSLMGQENVGQPFGYIAVSTNVEGKLPLREVLANSIICGYLSIKFLRNAKENWEFIYQESPYAKRVVSSLQTMVIGLQERYHRWQKEDNAVPENERERERDGIEDSVLVQRVEEKNAIEKPK